MDNDQRGRIGERFFSYLCERADMTPVRADPDIFGWDFHVTIQRAFPAKKAYELRAIERQCKVHVKTADVGCRSIGVKLSNWDRMAKELMPWFVVVLAMPLGSNDVQEIFLVHIDEGHVARALKRLREQDVAPKGELHEVRMNLPLSDVHRLASNEPEVLREKLLGYIGGSEDEYIENKSEWIRRSGFEGHPFKLAITATGTTDDEVYEAMADWSLGLRKELPASLREAVLTRFGIPRVVEGLPPGEVTLSMLSTPSIGTARATFVYEDRSELVGFECTVRAAQSVVPGLPLHHKKWLFVATFFTLLCRPTADGSSVSVELSLSIPTGDEPMSLLELSKVCKAVQMLVKAPDERLLVELQHDLFETAFDLTRARPEGLEPELRVFVQAAGDAAAVAVFCGLDLHETSVVPSELLDQGSSLRVFAACIDQTILDAGLRAGVAAAAGTEVEGKTIAIVLSPVVALGGHVLAGVSTMTGTADVQTSPEGACTVGIREPAVRFRRKRIAPKARWDDERFMSDVRTFAASLEAEGVEGVFVGALRVGRAAGEDTRVSEPGDGTPAPRSG